MTISRLMYNTARQVRRAYLRTYWKFFQGNSKLFFPTKNFYFSQSGQDGLIYNNFFKGKNGVFVDIGANHPVKLSNTFYFEQQGWSGFAFDPIEDMNTEWKDKRPNTKLTNIAIGSEKKTVSFNKTPNIDDWGNMLSSVVEDNSLDNSLQVQCLPLDEALTEKNIDLISIDVEGYEMNVLQGIDFSIIRPKVIVLENNSAGSVRWGDDKPRKYLRQHQYRLWGRIFGMDDIYLDELR